MAKKVEALLKFEANLNVEEVTKCWTWIGPIAYRDGKIKSLYFNANNKYISARKFIFERDVGPCEGFFLRPVCGNLLCVNPDHQDVGVQQENAAKGRNVSGKLVGFVKKDECKYGHAFPENRIVRSTGQSECRLCQRRRRAEYKKKRKIKEQKIF